SSPCCCKSATASLMLLGFRYSKAAGYIISPKSKVPSPASGEGEGEGKPNADHSHLTSLPPEEGDENFGIVLSIATPTINVARITFWRTRTASDPTCSSGFLRKLF